MGNNSKKKPTKPYDLIYDENKDAMVLKVIDPNETFPFFIDDKAGTYKINKNRTGKLQMTK